MVSSEKNMAPLLVEAEIALSVLTSLVSEDSEQVDSCDCSLLFSQDLSAIKWFEMHMKV